MRWLLFLFLSFCAAQEDGYTNVALDKTTIQSTTKYGGVSSRAVDGNTAGAWNSKSCTHTKESEDHPYWTVDLGRVYQIDHIRIYGRTDGWTWRLQGAKLWIGDHRCGTLTSTGEENIADVVKCSEAESAGRIVKIELMGEPLTLCEVQVMVRTEDIDVIPTVTTSKGEVIGDFTNVALLKPASQSTENAGGVPSRAVDGWALQKWNDGSCMHTKREGSVEWWEVDLESSFNVDHVKIYTRSDNTDYYKTFQGARVWLGNTLCGLASEDAVAEEDEGDQTIYQVSCPDDTYGRKVRVEKLYSYLMICEVQVMVRNEDLGDGDEMPTTTPSLYNVARRKTADQSSTTHGGVASRAVDGYTNGQWNDASCTHTSRDAAGYWQVDLEKEEYVSYIEIHGRKDCCGYRLEGAVITLDNRTIGALSYEDGQTQWTIDTNNLKGRYLKVSLEDEHLTLCEVKAMVDYNYDPSTDTNLVDLTLENLASAAVITSSSEWVGGEAVNAVDGQSDGSFYRGGCFSSGVQQGYHWWRATFGEAKSVGKVIIYPRLDGHDYLGGAEVRAGDNLCDTIAYDSDKLWYIVNCGGKQADSVTISGEYGWLQFCEVVIQPE